MKKILFSPDAAKLLQAPNEEKKMDPVNTYDKKIFQ